ncbi:hypothetical protein KKE47_05945 [Patescibacteria group bacterium]|nr:hypothetical protein [Patescibacteria group bacterium]MCG2702714.1 hypothetical protein [Candidatus Parcubacteria bacterium]MBU4265578.1 hypothetical protein [Patescibacteria group bacterium]MBU4390038.1 hypothetical protein [Patescibacteria group bacterium]MBU4430995.1 hypothetical protein [Patescibacteria group bacterium]
MTRNNLDIIDRSDEQQPREFTLENALVEIEQSTPGPEKVRKIIKCSIEPNFDIFSTETFKNTVDFFTIPLIVNRYNFTQLGRDILAGNISDSHWKATCVKLISDILSTDLNKGNILTQLVDDGIQNKFYYCGSCEDDLINRFTSFLIVLGIVDQKRKDPDKFDLRNGGLMSKCTFANNQYWNGHAVFQDILAELDKRKTVDKPMVEDSRLQK